MTSSFLDRMTGFGDAEAIVFDNTRYSYAYLVRRTADWREYLDAHGVRAGHVVVLESVSSVEACAGLLALIERGAIVVPLTPLPAAKRAEFHEVAEVEVVIAIEGEERACEHTGRSSERELYQQLRTAEVPGLVLFSSGTTGRSKATVLDFSKVLAKYGAPTRPKRTLAFLNLDHIGGINTLLHTLSQGGALITIPERTPETVCAAIQEHRVEVLPTTPTFLNMLLISGAYQRYDLTSLGLITYGTEPMPLGTLQSLKKAMPDVRFKQTYGLSELGIMPTKSKSDDTLWVKLGGEGFEYRITDGVLWIRSDMAMLGYLNAPAPFDEEGFFNTQDAVEVDGEYVRILGRKSEIINVAGEKVYPSEVENVLLEIPVIAEATVSGRPSPVTGMVVKATVTVSEEIDRRELTRLVREHCGRRLEAFKVPVVVEIAEAAQHNDRFKKIRSAA
ncbi:AMP-dependent synthetase [Kitasatospora sp. MMS16-BH015]|uniref:class I adenylate-forming enzyme family protein n=1 Tax=Kitasatospora sp. MMS16-BH015 TaxID=2018025 RepID=UPI000CA1D5FF|nr:fatty acid--CoA ligase family protein [Kitasatospora sp. MMS16-BH015]AUG78954.1 AMP-dependent synthetase [Kitasatospora sp. MMS16-BH015]